MNADPRVHKVRRAAEGPWLEVTFHRVRDDGMGQMYSEVGPPGHRIIHLLRLPYAIYEAMDRPTKLTVTLRTGDVHASTMTLWREE